MIISTTDYKHPYRSEGIVSSIQTMSLGIAKDFLAGIGEIFGKDVAKINTQFDTLRERAFKEIINKAENKTADGIIGIKMDFSQVSSPNGSGILLLAVYGTMIKLLNNDIDKKVNKGGFKKTLKKKK